MSAKTFVSTVLISTVAAIALAGPASAKSASEIRREAIEKREAAQEQSIRNGRQDGSLTYWEKLRLTREQRRIEALERKALADGRISRDEYRQVKSAQNDAGRHIREERTNQNVRGWWWRTFSR